MKHPLEDDRGAIDAIGRQLGHMSRGRFQITEDEDEDADDESDPESESTPEVVDENGDGWEIEIEVKARKVRGKKFPPGSGSWQKR